jgi:alpha/beta superfamily hydrolase
VVREREVTFPSGALTLEGTYYTAGDEEPRAGVVVCHPHPQYGGDMRNVVVSTVVRGALDAGLGALVFNFRGVGESEGAFDGGAGEREDVLAALAGCGRSQASSAWPSPAIHSARRWRPRLSMRLSQRWPWSPCPPA